MTQKPMTQKLMKQNLVNRTKMGLGLLKMKRGKQKKRTHDDTMDVATEKKGKCIQNIGQLRSETFL